MSRTHWTHAAWADLAAIDDYYAAVDPSFADRVGRQAIAAGRFLAAIPAAGAETASGHRRWRVAGTPYLLLYRIDADRVMILRVRHDRQDWPPAP